MARARERYLGKQDKEAAQRLFSLLDSRLQSDYAQRLAVATGGRIVFVPVADIDWIEANRNIARLHVGRETYELRETMTMLETRLNPKHFARVHRSAIVNVGRIAAIHPWFRGYHMLVLTTGQQLRMSRYQHEAFLKLTGRVAG